MSWHLKKVGETNSQVEDPSVDFLREGAGVGFRILTTLNDVDDIDDRGNA